MPESGAPRPIAELLLAFDVGARRIGVARGDTVSGAAAPLGHVRASAGVPDWSQIDTLMQRWQPGRLIVGLPYNVDDSYSAQTRLARRFASALDARYGVPVALVDERFSSLEAQERLRGARRSGVRRRRIARGDIDAAAACVILERWLADAH
jgi:putative Holliday junction resolvase